MTAKHLPLDRDHPHKYNERRLHGELGHVPPAEYEAAYWASQPVQPQLHDSEQRASRTDAKTASHAQTDAVLATAGTN